MQTLKPFQGSLPFGIGAEISIQGSSIQIEYKLDLQNALLKGLPLESAKWEQDQIPRLQGLWATTCFEAFLNPVGESYYYEFNFSLRPAWNGYEFTTYRDPQPPKETQTFALKGLSWEAPESRLTAHLENRSSHSEFNVSLTAVTEDQNQNKHYWALTHAENKPDFHSQKSFSLLRGSKR